MIVTSISEDKNAVVIGEKVFVFVEEEYLKSSCIKCAFIAADDCDLIPCMPHSRQPIDRKEGHFELQINEKS